MSIRNKSVYKKYLDILKDNKQDNRIPCPICNDGTTWGACNRHFSLELVYYVLALQWYTQFLETRTIQAEDRAMVCGKQNYDLRTALKQANDYTRRYRELAYDLEDQFKGRYYGR